MLTICHFLLQPLTAERTSSQVQDMNTHSTSAVSSQSKMIPQTFSKLGLRRSSVGRPQRESKEEINVRGICSCQLRVPLNLAQDISESKSISFDSNSFASSVHKRSDPKESANKAKEKENLITKKPSLEKAERNYANIDFSSKLKVSSADQRSSTSHNYANIDFPYNHDSKKSLNGTDISSDNKVEPDYMMMSQMKKIANEDLYTEMQPLSSKLIQESLVNKKLIDENLNNTNNNNNHQPSESYPGPLGPLLPLLFARLTQNPDSSTQKTNKSQSRPTTPQKSYRSGSFREFRRKILSRQRSNSTDRNNILIQYPLSDSFSSCPSSPALSSRNGKMNRKAFIFSKINWNSRERSLSNDHISPPTSVSSTPRKNRSTEGLYKAPFHRSADCLKVKFEDYKSSDEDLYTSSQVTVVLKTSPLKVSEASVGPPKLGPKRNPDKQQILENRDKRVNHKCKTDETKIIPSSTSSSDMSDYIETMSLSSRTSSGSNSSDPFFGGEDSLKSPPRTIASLKPRSAQEYLTVEREVISCNESRNYLNNLKIHKKTSDFDGAVGLGLTNNAENAPIS